MSQEDIIEDITEEALLEDQELVQDTSAEEVTEEQSYSDAIKSVLLGESKSSKKEVEEDEDEDDKEEDEDEDEMEEGYMKASKSKKKMEDEESDEEDEDEEEMDEATSKKEMDHSKKKKDEVEEDEDEDEDEDDMEEAAKPPTATGDPETAVIVKDGEKEAEETAKSIAKSEPKPAVQPKGGSTKVKGTDEEDAVASVKKAAETKPSAKQEDLDLLISAEANLTEDFKAKASVLFEAAVSQKIVAEKARLEETYEQNLIEEVTEIRESLITKIDDYLNYVVESWVEENQVEVDSKLRTEVAEGFMSSLKNLFVESYIEVPEAKVDLFDALEKEAAEVKENLEVATNEVSTLSEKLEVLMREKIISEQTKDLASTQVEKVKALTQEVEFVSEEVFTEKVATIKSSAFSSESDEDLVEDSDSETEVIVEGEGNIHENVSKDMKKYLSALSRIKENNPHGK